jgi:hypothetical protein
VRWLSPKFDLSRQTYLIRTAFLFGNLVMPPKKPRGYSNGDENHIDNDQNNEINGHEADESDGENSNDEVSEEEKTNVAQREALPTWRKGGGHHWNFNYFQSEFRKQQEAQAQIRGRLPDLIRRHVELLEAGNEAARQKWLKKDGRDTSRNAREAAHKRFVDAQSLMEDFLHYQNPVYRRKRLLKLNDNEKGMQRVARREARKRAKERKDRPQMVDGKTVTDKEHKLIDILAHFDEFGTGAAAHRSGITDANGRKMGKLDLVPRPVPPAELRLWTPSHRRVLGGLRNEPYINRSYDLVIDERAIAKRQAQVDRIPTPNLADGVSYTSHFERRLEERRIYNMTPHSRPGLERPSTSAMHPNTSQDGSVKLDRFRHIQTQQGLFISALESSYDWRTSYDYLGWIRSGTHVDFEVSEVREINYRPSDNGNENEVKTNRKVLVEFEKPGIESSRSAEEKVVQASAKISEQSREQQEGGKGGKGGRGRKRGNGGTATARANPRATNKAPTVTAETDYPYEAFEFTRPSKKLRLCSELPGERLPLETTTWTEETTGRRERHVHSNLESSSPVNSPPHSPIDSDTIAIESIPSHYPDTDMAPLEAGSRRRCKHDPERCRAWWTHDPDECWTVLSEPTRNLATDSSIPSPNAFILPAGGLQIYDERLIDHYGMRGSGTSMWPKLGIRVPYDPMTFDDRKLDSTKVVDGTVHDATVHKGIETIGPQLPDSEIEDSQKFRARDADLRNAHEVHTLAFPKIKIPQADWGEVGVEPSPGPGSEFGDGEESDDEGDLFHTSYHEGSRRIPSTAPSDLPVDHHVGCA